MPPASVVKIALIDEKSSHKSGTPEDFKQALRDLKRSDYVCMFKALILPTTFALFCIIMLLLFLITSLRQDNGIEATGRIQSSFRVFYHENDIFPYNPIPNTLHFLQSFTDFIEMDSGLIAQFGNEAVRIYYEYIARERLVIRYLATGDTNTNPIVYEESRILSTSYGNTESYRLVFIPQNANTPGGIYQIEPRQHLRQYLDFVERHTQQMVEGTIAPNVRGFGAELFIDFTYVIRIPELNFNQTLTQGYRFTISSEVFNIIPIGSGSSNFTEIIYTESNYLPFLSSELTILISILLVLCLTLSLFFILRAIKNTNVDENKYRQEAFTIIKKYANEIVVSPDPAELYKYSILRVEHFDELIKLAINLNKHIICYHDNEVAQFSVIVDDHAYFYQISYDPVNSKKTRKGRVISTLERNQRKQMVKGK